MIPHSIGGPRPRGGTAGRHLIGLSADEVVRRLGRPRGEHYDGRRLSWFVGVTRNAWWDFPGLYDDRVFLEVLFADGRAVEAREHIDRH